MSNSDGDMLPISLNTVLAGGYIDCDLYLLDEARQAKLYRGKGYPFTADDIAALRQRGTRCLYIHSGDASRYRDHVRSRIVNDNSIPVQKRFEIIREASRSVVEEAWQQGGIDTAVWVTGELAEQLTTLITDEKLVFQDLLDLMLFDYSAYAHAANVCSFAVVVAKAHGICEREHLTQIAKGALLHDIGKQLTAVASRKGAGRSPGIDKPDSKSHPAVGFKRLSTVANISWGTLMMIYQHHEQPDGGGYPVGLQGEEIHPWARICAVANYFEKQRRLQQNTGCSNVPKLRAALVGKSGSLLDTQLTTCLLSLLESSELAEVT